MVQRNLCAMEALHFFVYTAGINRNTVLLWGGISEESLENLPSKPADFCLLALSTDSSDQFETIINSMYGN
jgi:hypothetical protein